MTIRDRFFTLPEILLIYAVWGVAQNGHRSGTEFGIFVDTEWTQKLALFGVLGGYVWRGICGVWGGMCTLGGCREGCVGVGVWGCPGVGCKSGVFGPPEMGYISDPEKVVLLG